MQLQHYNREKGLIIFQNIHIFYINKRIIILYLCNIFILNTCVYKAAVSYTLHSYYNRATPADGTIKLVQTPQYSL